MKITHTKKQNRRWTIVLETELEAHRLLHLLGCGNKLPGCEVESIRNGRFNADFYAKLRAVLDI